MTKDIQLDQKVYRLPNGIKLVDVWHEIHRLCDKHQTGSHSDQEAFDALIHETLHDLTQVDAPVWRQLCLGVGPTVYGAVALSWCKGAHLGNVWEDWRASGYAFTPDPYSERPAHFINDDLLPRLSSVKSMAEQAAKNELQICAMIIRSPEPVEFDLPFQSIMNTPPMVTHLLRSRLAQQEPKSQNEIELYQHWFR